MRFKLEADLRAAIEAAQKESLESFVATMDEAFKAYKLTTYSALADALRELLDALDDSACADAGHDDVAAMLRYADAEKAARAAIAKVCDSDPAQAANARLIAAAPNLYDAAIAARSFLRMLHDIGEDRFLPQAEAVVAELEAAITKAKP